MKSTVTVIVEDRWISVDGEQVNFEEPFTLIPEHEKLWALHWKDNAGEYQFDNPPENYFFTAIDYDKFVAPYVAQWEEEKARQDAEKARLEAEELAEYNKIENVEARARERRNELLSATDYMLMPDYPLSDAQRTAWSAYRQALRDLPEQEGWPMNIVWPEEPNAVA